MDTPLVSIITVVFNGEKYLEQTIQSVINQTYNNIEYIIIDGGSSDDTLNIVRKYNNDISLWISEPDKGLYDAMNKGIKFAKGELIGIINSDDWYELDAVTLVVDAFNKYPEKRIFHGDRYDIFQNGKKRIRRYNPSEFKFKYYGMTYNHPSMFVHRDIYKSTLYNEDLPVLSDYEFVLTQFLMNKNEFCYIPEPYVNYRLDGISSRARILNSLLDGFTCRKNAGMGLLSNAFSFFVRFIIFFCYGPFLTLLNKNGK